jgi:uroporphyrin-III C-methyltransferase
LRADTPAAIVRAGTLPGRQLCTATLADLPQRAAQAGIVPPALIVIGRVAAFARDKGVCASHVSADFAAFVREAGHA